MGTLGPKWGPWVPPRACADQFRHRADQNWCRTQIRGLRGVRLKMIFDRHGVCLIGTALPKAPREALGSRSRVPRTPNGSPSGPHSTPYGRCGAYIHVCMCIYTATHVASLRICAHVHVCVCVCAFACVCYLLSLTWAVLDVKIGFLSTSNIESTFC